MNIINEGEVKCCVVIIKGTIGHLGHLRINIVWPEREWFLELYQLQPNFVHN